MNSLKSSQTWTKVDCGDPSNHPCLFYSYLIQCNLLFEKNWKSLRDTSRDKNKDLFCLLFSFFFFLEHSLFLWGRTMRFNFESLVWRCWLLVEKWTRRKTREMCIRKNEPTLNCLYMRWQFIFIFLHFLQQNEEGKSDKRRSRRKRQKARKMKKIVWKTRWMTLWIDKGRNE